MKATVEKIQSAAEPGARALQKNLPPGDPESIKIAAKGFEPLTQRI
jgi:hypothetical protein